MVAVSPPLYSFNAGEVSPFLEGRIDLDAYASSCRRLRDFIPMAQGPITKRFPTKYINPVKDSAKSVRLIPFQFSIEQAYVLEFGDYYARVYKDDGIVLDGAGPAVYEFVHPYAHTELDDIYYAQQNDIMLLAHPDYPPKRLSRLADDNWLMEDAPLKWGPFLDENIDDTKTIAPSGVTGSVTLTANTPLFNAEHVGSYWRLAQLVAAKNEVWQTNVAIVLNNIRYYGQNVYRATNAATTGVNPPVHLNGTESDGAVSWEYLHSGEGYAKVTAFTSTTVVTADVIERLPTTAATDVWNEGAWSEYQGYPGTVAFYESRLFWGGTKGKPQTIWGSRTDEYDNYQGGSNASDGLRYTISTDRVNAIKWMAPSKTMAIGTSGGEFTMEGGTSGAALTPSNVRITRESTYGSEKAVPLIIGPRVLFIQRGGKKVREYAYDYDTDSFLSPDLSIKSDILPLRGIKQIVYQQSPYQVAWIVRNDGKLIGMTHNVEQKVIAWHLHAIAGGNVESIAVIPDDVSNEDQVWLVVNRVIDGATQRHVELFLPDESVRLGEPDASLVYLDAQLSYSGAPVTTVSGLDHLEGKTVGIQADGSEHPDKVVTGGAVTLDREASEVTVGLRYYPLMETMRIEAGAAEGTAQGKTKRLHNLTMRVFNATPGIYYGADDDKLFEIHMRQAGDAMDAPVPEFSGDIGPKVWPGGYSQKGTVIVQHRGTGAFILTALFPQLKTMDRT